jgi:hypothetical protein
MGIDFRCYAHTLYLSLALGLPVPPDRSLRWYDDRLQVIESHLKMGNSHQMIELPLDESRIELLLNEIPHRAALAYGYYTGRCPQFRRLPADLPRPENDSSPPRSPAEKQALLREVKRLTHGTRKCKHRLPDNMLPGFMTWEYIDA